MCAMSISLETAGRSAPRTAAQRFASAAAFDVPPLAVLAALVAEPSTRDFALVNVLVQAVLFAFGACLPAYRTRLTEFRGRFGVEDGIVAAVTVVPPR